jgi:hypothetical protein
MKNNVSLKNKTNEDSKKILVPAQASRIRVSVRTPETTPKSSPQKPVSMATPGASHRKSRSFLQDSSPNIKLTPNKHPVALSSTISGAIDIKAYEAEVLRLKSKQLKNQKLQNIAEKEEWYRINNERKQKINKEIIEHEGYLVNEQINYTKMNEEKEKTRKYYEQKEKEDEFHEFIQAKKKLKEIEKLKEKELIQLENEKYIKNKIQLEEQKLLKKSEQEEKIKLRLEAIEAKKNLMEQERLREQKEKELELTQYALSLREFVSKQGL